MNKIYVSKYFKISERNTATFFEYKTLESVHFNIKKLLSWRSKDETEHPFSFVVSSIGGGSAFYYDLSAWNEYALKVVEEVRGGRYNEDLFEVFDKTLEDSLNIIDKAVLSNNKLELLRNTELADLFEENYKEMLAPDAIMFIAADLAYSLEGDIRKLIENKTNGKEDSDEWLGILTEFKKESGFAEEKSKMYEIALKISRDQELLELFKKADIKSLVSELSNQYKDIEFLINQHLDLYGWMHIEYVNEPPSLDDYVLELASIIRINTKQELVEKSAELRDSKTSRLKQKYRFIQQYNLSDSEKMLIDAASSGGYFYTHAKNISVQIYSLVRPLFREIGKRFSLKWIDVLMLTPQEIVGMLKSATELKELVEQRKTARIIQFKDGSITAKEGKSAFELVNKNDTAKVEKAVKGSIANKGLAEGYVRIVLNASSLEKVQDGDILVTTTTTPEFVPALGRVKAILAEEGGLLSHAAIVSRELGIPCLVNCKNVTKILKDGDYIEVDANKGSIKIQKK